MTAADYLAVERASGVRHEYLDGQVFAMAGASRRHNLISGDAFKALDAALAPRGCETYVGDMRVRIPATELYTYPDVVAVCETPLFEDEVEDTLENPTLIVEVLSPSTEAYDRGKKFAHYRTLDSLAAYLLLAQDEPRAELFERQAGGTWVLHTAEGTDASLTLSSLDLTLPLAELYRRSATSA